MFGGLYSRRREIYENPTGRRINHVSIRDDWSESSVEAENEGSSVAIMMKNVMRFTFGMRSDADLEYIHFSHSRSGSPRREE